jgi:hypothetical protein
MTRTITIETYVLDVLMQDLIGHDRTPAAFLVYLYLYGLAERSNDSQTSISHARLSEATGLSKSAVQISVKHLVRRKLLKMALISPTAVPVYTVLKPWARHR